MMNASCHWPFSTLLVLSDLTVVCGCTDPLKTRVLGHAGEESARDVWTGKRLRGLRKSFDEGVVHPYCKDCYLFSQPTGAGCKLDMENCEKGPVILQVEPSIRCNLRCPSPHCDMNNQGGTRDADFMKFEDFKRIFDSVGEHVEVLRMYNYGEPFLNADTFKMVAYAREQRPDVYIDVHTNGGPLNNDERRQAFVECGLDNAIFSIDGFWQESYEQYRRKGNVRRTLENLQSIIALRNAKGLTRPFICWRYILFKWNDSEAETSQALQFAEEIGVDQFTWLLNCGDQSWNSTRVAPGQEIWSAMQHGLWDASGEFANALFPSRRAGCPAPLRDAARLESETSSLTATPCEKLSVTVRVQNTGSTMWRAGAKRGCVLLSGFIYSGEGLSTVAHMARTELPHNMLPGECVELAVEFYAPETPGGYIAEVDMVSEFKYWFASQENPPLRMPLIVAAPA